MFKNVVCEMRPFCLGLNVLISSELKMEDFG